MAKAVMKVDDKGVSATLVAKDRKGNVVTLPEKPRWSLTDEAVAELTVSDDGMTATITPKAPGTTTINAVVDADPSAEVRDINATGEIEVQAADAQTLEVSFVALPNE